MKLTITHYLEGHTGPNGAALPLGGGILANETLTADGDTTASPGAATICRIATDTACTLTFPGGNDEYMPAGNVEFFALSGGGQITVAAEA